MLSLDEAGQQLKYRAPKGALSTLEKASLRDRRIEVLRFLRAKAVAVRPPLRPNGGGATPSFTQELWWRSACTSPTQNSERRLPLFATFCDTSMTAVQTAVRTLIARHEALRYSFTDSNGLLGVAVNDAAAFHVDFEPLPPQSSLCSDDMPVPVAQFISAAPLLEGQWLVHARVFLESNGEGTIVFVLHHNICDGTSLGILTEDLSSLLADAREGRQLDAQQGSPVETIQFSDFAAWERAHFTGETAERLAAYWVNWLQAVPPLIHPHTRAPLEWRVGDRVDYAFEFDGAAVCEFGRLTREIRVTPFMLILALFSLALFRWSGQLRYAILSVADGRTFPETLALRRTVGPILYMDPIEVRLPQSLELVDVLHMLQTNYTAARELRFPLNGCLPGLREHEFIHRIGATINYRDLRPNDFIPQPPAAFPNGPEPTAPLPRPGPEAADHYDVPLQPINLRVEQSAESITGKLEFNELRLFRAEQHRIVDQVMGEFEKLLFASRRKELC